MPKAWLLAGVLSIVIPAVAATQTPSPPVSDAAPACPPGTTGDPPKVGDPRADKPLSDRLADSRGVICPPAGVDPEIRKAPPDGGTLRIVPPPGSPGGNPNSQPK